MNLALIALEGNFAYSFMLGMLAAVNPCGFVLLPAYLLYFYGRSYFALLTRYLKFVGNLQDFCDSLKVLI